MAADWKHIHAHKYECEWVEQNATQNHRCLSRLIFTPSLSYYITEKNGKAQKEGKKKKIKSKNADFISQAKNILNLNTYHNGNRKKKTAIKIKGGKKQTQKQVRGLVSHVFLQAHTIGSLICQSEHN